MAVDFILTIALLLSVLIHYTSESDLELNANRMQNITEQNSRKTDPVRIRLKPSTIVTVRSIGSLHWVFFLGVIFKNFAFKKLWLFI